MVIQRAYPELSFEGIAGQKAPVHAKPIQRVTITIPAGATQADYTLPIPVDVNYAHPINNGFEAALASADISKAAARLELINANTVRAYRNTSDGSVAVVVEGKVVEWAKWALLRPVQQGVINLSTAQTSNTATVTGAALGARSIVLHLGYTTASTTLNPAVYYSRVSKSGNTVTGARNTAGSLAMAIGWACLDFSPLAVESVQEFLAVSGTTNTVDTIAVSSVDFARSSLFYNGLSTASTSTQNGSWRAAMTSGTNINLTRTGTSASSRTQAAAVVTWQPWIVKQIQRYTMSMSTGVASTDATLSPVVNTDKTLTHFNGFSTVVATGEVDDNYPLIHQVDLDTVTAVRGGTAAGPCIAGGESVEFY